MPAIEAPRCVRPDAIAGKRLVGYAVANRFSSLGRKPQHLYSIQAWSCGTRLEPAPS
ncbi:hypothetical protein EMIT0196P_30076 [Pseudomonas chlororaphis]